jgi:myo-inositol-1-phosphate synthase
MGSIRVAIFGVGNCASSLVQGRYYYSDKKANVPGLITKNFGGYYAADIEYVAAFDIDKRKVGLDLSKAIFSPPNCTTIFQSKIPLMKCPVEQGFIIDSIPAHNAEFNERQRFQPIKNRDASAAEAKARIVKSLKSRGVEIVVNYLPVGSEQNVRFYAQCALEAGCAFVNAVPVFVSKVMGEEFRRKGLPILGDDIKSQVGATIVHRVLAKLFEDRGQSIKRTYQLNVGGNTDFMNMLDRARLESKKISKTQAVTSLLNGTCPSKDDIHVGPSDYVPWLNDNKLCFIRMEAEQFGGVPMNLELRLSVEDSPNSAGVITDAIRAARVALDRKLAGPIVEASAYLFKSPVSQFDDSIARQMLIDFASGVKPAGPRTGTPVFSRRSRSRAV